MRLRVEVATDGSVKELSVLSGYPLLTKAAVDAVRQWRYRPTVLNGVAVEIVTEVTIDLPA